MMQKRGVSKLSGIVLLFWTLLNLMIIPFGVIADGESLVMSSITHEPSLNSKFAAVSKVSSHNPVQQSNALVFPFIFIFLLGLSVFSLALFNGKKAQMTLFILLGLVIMIIFGFL